MITDDERVFLDKVRKMIEYQSHLEILATMTRGYERSAVMGHTTKSSDVVFADILEDYARFLRREMTPKEINDLGYSIEAFSMSMLAQIAALS